MTFTKAKLVFIIEFIMVVFLFYTAFIYENAKDIRAILLISLFCIYFIIFIIHHRIKSYSKTTILLYVSEIGLIFTIEMYSKYAINYFIHSLYIIIILDAALTLNKKKGLIINIAAVLISQIKYIYLISINKSITNIAGMVFFILINLLILTITYFAKYYREEKDKTAQLYRELLNAHKKLQNYSDKIRQLTLIEERNRITKDLHDTLGHNITGLIMQLEMASSLINEDLDTSKQLIEASKENARNNLKQVRTILSALREDTPYDTIDSIKDLVSDFSKKTGIDIQFHVGGTIIKLSPDGYIILYRIIQEAMTNAVRHGQASKIDIHILFRDSEIQFKVEDNGIGCDIIIEGFGLKGMKDRVSQLGGTISYHSTHGFIINGSIPFRSKS